jgi:ankyrin repeat protein
MCSIFKKCCKKPNNHPTITFNNPDTFEYKLCVINNIDNYGNTALHNARTHEYMREILNNKNVNVNIQNNNGDTPLHICDKPELAVMLLASGADPDIKNIHNQTPVDTAKNDVQKCIVKQFSISSIN